MSSRMSSADTAWLHMDRPTNLMVINSLLLFDEPVDWERVKQIVQRRMVDRYPRFRQRVVESRLPLRAAKWEDDPDFALEHHLHHLGLPAPEDAAALQELVGDLMTMPLDRNRPLWHFYMVDGFAGGAAMICRMHHCIGDGLALAQVMLSLTDSDRDVEVEPDDDGRLERRPGGLLTAVAGTGSRVLTVAGHVASVAFAQAGETVRAPGHAHRLVGAVGRDGATAVRLLLTPADAASAIKGDPGISRRVSWSEPLALPRIKRVARSHNATVNDVLLAAVSGALRHYLQDRGSAVHEIQAMVPFNLRALDQPVPRDLGNKFGLVFLPLPVGVSGGYRRLVEVHERMGKLKRSRDASVSYALLSAAGLAPEPVERRIVDMFSAKCTAVMTNVPGPRKAIYLTGTPVRTALFWAPTSGHIGMSVSIFSYRDEVTVGLMVDAALTPDPGEIIKQLERELDALDATRPRARHRRQEHKPRANARTRSTGAAAIRR